MAWLVITSLFVNSATQLINQIVNELQYKADTEEDNYTQAGIAKYDNSNLEIWLVEAWKRILGWNETFPGI